MPTNAQKLVIVESPTKAKTIRKFLGKEFRVEASVGHVRDLPKSADDIPAEFKKREWARLGVNVDDAFQPIYVVPVEKRKLVAELKEALRGADELFVATDEDREGESIAWHLVEVLRPKVPVRRMVFHEITRDAIRHALESPREIDERLVQQQETRRVLDRLVGYVVSPLLWKKIRGGLSAGRVQSVAVRLLVLRERERMAFRSGWWWDLAAALRKGQAGFEARLHAVNGDRIATSRDFDEHTGRLRDNAGAVLLDEETARRLETGLRGRPFRVIDVETRPSARSPYPPFVTSTLQQEANRKLGMSAAQAMSVAQRLYENGHITYMRTDSVHLSSEALDATRGLVSRRYGPQFLSPSPRQFQTKSLGAQEAHEAIRPAGTAMATAEELGLQGADARLYDMIWKRTVATQMADARLSMTSARILAEAADGTRTEFRASGREVVFPGFFRAYVEGSDDPDEALEDRNSPLPPLAVGDELGLDRVDATGHETRPPARYTEATLIKALEKEGVGRPSTYARILDTIEDRGYCVVRNKQLIPSFTAMAVTSLLEETLRHIVDTEFTAAMEERLDSIGAASDALAYLQSFYRDDLLQGVASAQSLDPRRLCTLRPENIAPFTVRIGRYGPYVELPQENGEKPLVISLPDDVAPADLTPATIAELQRTAALRDRPLGEHPETGVPVFVMSGRYGPYVQLGPNDQPDKPKRVSLPPGRSVETLSFSEALALLSLPRELGPHPETGKPVRAGIGQYGPYVLHDGKYASLRAGDDVLSVGIARALELFAGKRTRGEKQVVQPLRVLGDHPVSGKPVSLMPGRYGPYVAHDGINASLAKSEAPESVTMERAVELLAAREARGPSVKKARRGGSSPGSRARATKTAAAQPRAAAKTARGASKGKRSAPSTAPAKPRKPRSGA